MVKAWAGDWRRVWSPKIIDPMWQISVLVKLKLASCARMEPDMTITPAVTKEGAVTGRRS
jgi:hypothetical protein